MVLVIGSERKNSPLASVRLNSIPGTRIQVGFVDAENGGLASSGRRNFLAIRAVNRSDVPLPSSGNEHSKEPDIFHDGTRDFFLSRKERRYPLLEPFLYLFRPL